MGHRQPAPEIDQRSVEIGPNTNTARTFPRNNNLRGVTKSMGPLKLREDGVEDVVSGKVIAKRAVRRRIAARRVGRARAHPQVLRAVRHMHAVPPRQTRVVVRVCGREEAESGGGGEVFGRGEGSPSLQVA